MARLLIFCAVLATIYFAQTNALKCYRCQSDTYSNVNFCADPFDPSNINESQRRSYLIDCDGASSQFPISIAPKTSCRKLVTTVNGRTTINRGCVYVNNNDDGCSQQHPGPGGKLDFCETCINDACNGAIGYAPVATLIAICSALLYKLL